MFANKIAILTLYIFSTSFVTVSGQCLNLLSTFPGTLNGITVTETITGDVTTFTSTFVNCGVTAGPRYLGADLPFVQTLTFSNPVNYIIYVLNSSEKCGNEIETFSFSVNSGALSCNQSGSSCLFAQSGNIFIANLAGISNSVNAAFIKLTSTIPYTSLSVSGSGGCKGSLMALCWDSSVGINSSNFLVSGVRAYPNPVSESLKIRFELLHKTSIVQLVDVLGNIVRTKEIKNNEEEIDVRDLNAGIYSLTIRTEEGVYKERIIIQR